MAGKETRNVTTSTPGTSSTPPLSLALSEKLTLMANFDYGKEGDVKWWGVAGYAKLQASPNWALVGRYEYLDDTRGRLHVPRHQGPDDHASRATT